jgi:4-hydroxybenzoate polyprenyltransferase
MLIIEILLTIAVWSRYKWLALIPLGVAFGIGLIIGAAGGSIDGPIWLVDVAAIIALVVMIFVKKKPEVEVKEKVEE